MSGYLLDTSVLSEVIKKRPEPSVLARYGARRRPEPRRCRVVGFLAAMGEATEVPRRSSGRGPRYGKSRVLRRPAFGDEDHGQGGWALQTA